MMREFGGNDEPCLTIDDNRIDHDCCTLLPDFVLHLFICHLTENKITII